jgi:hypothetical protein
MSKCAKIICTYFGRRRTGTYNNPKDMKSFFLKMMENEVSIDMGIETDIILVNNDCGIVSVNEGVNSFNNKKTRNGKVIVEQRENIGGSFGSYFDMFTKYLSEYDYFFFCEDDHIIFKEGYMKDFVDFIDSDDKVGYVALAPITLPGLNGLPVHSGGGIGLTSTKKFNMIYGENSICNFRHEMTHGQSYNKLQNYESRFNSNFIIHGGFEIKNHPKYSCIPNNYKNFEVNYRFYLNEENLQKEFIYNVGE